MSFTNRLIDYVVDHPTHGTIYFEVKDINCPPRERIGQFDPYQPIRSHIEEGKDKFKGAAFEDQLCALVLFAPPGSLVHIDPRVMLGAMYGNHGWTIPVDTETGVADPSRVESTFLAGEGKMIGRSEDRNTRIAALISLVKYNTFTKEAERYLCIDDGRSREERLEDLASGRAAINGEQILCVTVWENGTARRKLPQDIFRGQMDAWWTCDENEQCLSFVGERRRNLEVDAQR